MMNRYGHTPLSLSALRRRAVSSCPHIRWASPSFALLCLVLGGLAAASPLHAQLDTNSSLYWAAPTLYNPATSGCDSALHVTAFDRMQWVGVTNAPQTFFVSADMPFMLGRKRTGLGLAILNDQAGLFTTTFVNAQLNYSLKLWGGRLALGLQPGFVNQSFKGSEVYMPSGNTELWDASVDNTIPTGDVSGMGFDLGLGAYYERGWFYGGISAQHLTATELELGDYAYSELSRTYYFHAGGNIPVKRTLFILQPSVIVKTTFQFTQYDFTLRTLWDRRFWGGISYRPGDAVVLMVGADINHIRLGYAYDAPISQMSIAAGGSHELLATYTLHIDLDKTRNRGSKSIRIL